MSNHILLEPSRAYYFEVNQIQISGRDPDLVKLFTHPMQIRQLVNFSFQMGS